MMMMMMMMYGGSRGVMVSGKRRGMLLGLWVKMRRDVRGERGVIKRQGGGGMGGVWRRGHHYP